MSSEFIVRKIEVDDLADVSRIHRASFTDSALSHLGAEAVRRYYDWLLTGPHDVIPICAFNHADEMAGFCFGGVFRGALSGFIHKNKRYLFGHITLHPWLLFNPIVRDQANTAVKIIKSSLYKSKPKPKRPIKYSEVVNTSPQRPCGVLSIAVDPDFQHKGIGKLLMDEIEKQAKKYGYKNLALTVHPHNHAAISFYEKLGWVKTYKTEPWSGHMEKSLKQPEENNN